MHADIIQDSGNIRYLSTVNEPSDMKQNLEKSNL